MVVISGGKPRLDLTIQTLKSVNGQSLKPKEKIFINHGHTQKIMELLFDSEQIGDDWKIISFPINTYDPKNLDSLFKFTGPASLDAATSNYIFYIADDDQISLDFFERMSNLINGELDVTMATGLAVSLDKNNSLIYPPAGSWSTREKYQRGIEVFRNIFKPDELYQPNPGHSYIIKRSILEEVRSTIFTFGFPDLTPLFQILPKGLFAFDKDAHMLRRNHIHQIHNDWDKQNNNSNSYILQFKRMAEININVMKNSKKVGKRDLALAKKYFKKQITRACWFSIKDTVPDLGYSKTKLRTNLRLKLIYAIYMLRTPVYSLRLVIQPGKIKNIFKKYLK